MDIKLEIEEIPRYDWTYSDGMDFNRGVGHYVTWKDAKLIWDALLGQSYEGVTVSSGQRINRETVLSNAKDNIFTYRVEYALDFYDIIGMFIDGINTRLVDDVVEDGYLLGDIGYKVVAVNEDGKMTIEVSVNTMEYQ